MSLRPFWPFHTPLMERRAANTAEVVAAALISVEDGVTAVDGAQEIATGEDMAMFMATPTTEDTVIPIILILTGIGQLSAILMACAIEFGFHIIECREGRRLPGRGGRGRN